MKPSWRATEKCEPELNAKLASSKVSTTSQSSFVIVVFCCKNNPARCAQFLTEGSCALSALRCHGAEISFAEKPCLVAFLYPREFACAAECQ